MLPAFMCASTVDNNNNLGLRNLRFEWLETLATQTTQYETLVSPFPCFPFGIVPLSKALITFYLPSRSIISF